MPRKVTPGTPRQKALGILEVTEADVAALPQISHLTKVVGKTPVLIEYLSGSENEDARKVVLEASKLTVSALTQIPIEALCAAAKVSTKRLFGILSEEVMEQGERATKLLAQASHPRVVKKTIDVAMTADGTPERKMLLQASGFLPSAQKHVTQFFGRTEIDARAQAALPQTAVLPPVEDSVRRLSDRFLSAAPAQIAAPEVVDAEMEDIEE